MAGLNLTNNGAIFTASDSVQSYAPPEPYRIIHVRTAVALRIAVGEDPDTDAHMIGPDTVCVFQIEPDEDFRFVAAQTGITGEVRISALASADSLEQTSSQRAVDPYTGAVIGIDLEHARIHEGRGFAVSLTASVANAANFDLLLKNPAASHPHLRLYKITAQDAPGTVRLYENPTTTLDGAAEPALNLNRNSANVADLAVFSSPTVSAAGTQLEADFIAGEKKTGGSMVDVTQEWILKPSEDYLLRYTNNSGVTTAISVNLFWYEPPD